MLLMYIMLKKSWLSFDHIYKQQSKLYKQK